MSQTLSSGDPSSTAVRNQRVSDRATREAENAAYNQFKGTSGTGADVVSNNVMMELSKILQNNPDFGKSLIKISNRTGQKGLYRIDKNGRVMFARTPTVLEAEKIRRIIKETGGKEFDAKDYDLSFATDSVEKGLRNLLDAEVPELMSVRAQAAAVRANRDAFQAGRTALSKDVNEIELDIEEIYSKNPEAFAAFRAGFLASLQRKFKSGQQAGTVGNLLSEDRAAGQILRTIIPDANDLSAVLRKLDIAKEAADVAQPVLRGTQTAESIIAKNAQNAGITMAEGAGVLSGNVSDILGVTKKLVGSINRELTDAQRTRIAEILVSQDVDLVRRAISDERGIARLQEKVNNLIPRLARGGAQIGSRQAAEASAGIFGGATSELMRELMP